MFRFEGLDIWNAAVAFANSIYKITENLPQLERYALGDQLRRASVSISANIVEGSGSASNKDFQNYLSVAVKSLFEVVSLLKIAEQNGYISGVDYLEKYKEAEELAKKTNAFRNTLSH